MKVKIFGVATEESILSKFGIGGKRGGLPELEVEINGFIMDKKVNDIKIVTASSSYQNNIHTMMCAIVLYDEPVQNAPQAASPQPR